MTTRVEWHGEEVSARLNGASQPSLLKAAEHLLEESNRSVPLLEGTLQRSGTADADDTAGVVAYDTPYARRQHEHLEYRHTDGRRAKWLELTFTENISRVLDWLKGPVDKALGG